jgi:DNA-binding transcriptional regulator YiaG
MITGDDVRAARERVQETQGEFARRFGVDQSAVSRWEVFGIPSRGTTAAFVELVLAQIGGKKR